MPDINNSDLVHVILENAYRFEVEENNKTITHILNACSIDNAIIHILRLRRKGNPLSEWKTLVIRVMDSVEGFRQTLNTIASIKDLLIDPESSDLYFFGAFNNTKISKFEILKYESSDLFCRKYILRPGEDLPDFLQRTFLSDLKTEKSDESISDPLSIALSVTSQDHRWLIEEKQKLWREAFLSGKSGFELIDLIFDDNE
jgi:hypothetical protein